MKVKISYFVFVVLIIAGGYFELQGTAASERPGQGKITLDFKTIASDLNVPWEITWGPDDWIWFTEQSGTVSKVNPKTGEKKVLLRIPEVYRFRSLGLLGMAIHPDKKQPYVFLDYTHLDTKLINPEDVPKGSKNVKDGRAILSRLIRYTYTADTLLDPVVLLKDIPGATGHNGSRITIAPDGKLMMSTGDVTKSDNAQDIYSINGKILRLNIDGSIPSDNPVPGSPVWSLGHRNIQGLVYGPNGRLYSSEHGDAIEDELNLIQKNANYGWPNVEGFCNTAEEKTFCAEQHVKEPLKAWTPVIAPAGIDYYASDAIPEWKNSILLTTLKTESLRVLKLNGAGDGVLFENIYLDHQFGRLRDVCISPAGEIYVATSNRDWNPGEGYPKKGDDRIIKIFKSALPKSVVAAKNPVAGKRPAIAKQPASAPKTVMHPGALVYKNYCESCHKTAGQGIAGVFPPLKGAQQVTGDKNVLIRILLKGLSGPITVKGVKYDQDMPAFSFLSDKDIALVASYIRTQFGNKASAVTTLDVSKIRGTKK